MTSRAPLTARSTLGLVVGMALALGAGAASEEVTWTQTGKVPVEGALAASHERPEPGESVFLYLSVTPLVALEDLELSLSVPEERAQVIGAASVRRVFARVAAGETVRLDVPLRVRAAGELRFLGHASWNPGDRRRRGRSFGLILHPEPPKGRAPRSGTSADGEPLVIYPGE